MTNAPFIPTDKQLPVLRTIATHLLDYAVCGDRGRNESDKVYDSITEHRDRGVMRAKYSSCGDLGHWLVYRLGCRETWVNRAENGGWRVGLNVNLLYGKQTHIGGNPMA